MTRNFKQLEPNEQILEYECTDVFDIVSGNNIITSNQSIYLYSKVPIWILPHSNKVLNLNIKFWIPDNTILLLTKNNFINPKLDIQPQILSENNAKIIVHNPSILPQKIDYDTLFASIYIIPTNCCHVIKH